MKLANALKGITGEFELNRVLGAAGGVSYIIGAHVFVAWNMAKGHEFDLTAYCVVFPGGLAGLGLSTAGAVSIKDRNVAAAKATEATTNATNAETARSAGGDQA